MMWNTISLHCWLFAIWRHHFAISDNIILQHLMTSCCKMTPPHNNNPANRWLDLDVVFLIIPWSISWAKIRITTHNRSQTFLLSSTCKRCNYVSTYKKWVIIGVLEGSTISCWSWKLKSRPKSEHKVSLKVSQKWAQSRLLSRCWLLVKFLHFGPSVQESNQSRTFCWLI